MDKIWYRNPSKSEVIDRCGGDEKTEWPRRTDKNQTLKKNNLLLLATLLITIIILTVLSLYIFR